MPELRTVTPVPGSIPGAPRNPRGLTCGGAGRGVASGRGAGWGGSGAEAGPEDEDGSVLAAFLPLFQVP